MSSPKQHAQAGNMPCAHMTLLEGDPSEKYTDDLPTQSHGSSPGGTRSLHLHSIASPPSTLQPTISPTRTTTLAPSRKSHQTYPPRDLRTGRWWCRESRGVRGGRLLHDASTANHSARADGLAFQFAVSPPRACNDTLNTLRHSVPLLPPLVLRS